MSRVISGVYDRPTDSTTMIARGMNDWMWSLMQFCWSIDPADRPSMATVLTLLSFLPTASDELSKSTIICSGICPHREPLVLINPLPAVSSHVSPSAGQMVFAGRAGKRKKRDESDSESDESDSHSESFLRLPKIPRIWAPRRYWLGLLFVAYLSSSYRHKTGPVCFRLRGGRAEVEALWPERLDSMNLYLH